MHLVIWSGFRKFYEEEAVGLSLLWSFSSGELHFTRGLTERLSRAFELYSQHLLSILDLWQAWSKQGSLLELARTEAEAEIWKS